MAERMQNNYKSFKIRLLHAPTYGNVNPLAVCQNNSTPPNSDLSQWQAVLSFVWDFSEDKLPSGMVDVPSFGHDMFHKETKGQQYVFIEKIY